MKSSHILRKLTMVKKIFPNVLINAENLATGSFGPSFHLLMEDHALLGKKIFRVNGSSYVIDHAQVASNATFLADLLVKTKGDVTVYDVVHLPSVITLPPRDKEVPLTYELYPLYSAQVFHDSVDWPVKDAINGAVILLGDTGSGKSTFVKKILDVDFILRYSEPQEDVDLDPRSIPVSSLTMMITVSTTLAAMGLRVAVDSLRSLVYGMEGNAIEGGMSAGIYDFVSQVNNLFADIGHPVILTVNPLIGTGQDAELKSERTFNRLAALCSGAYHLDSDSPGTVRARTFRLTSGRISVGGNGSRASFKDMNSSTSTVKDPTHLERDRSEFTILNMNRLKGNEATVNSMASSVYAASYEEGDDDNKRRSPRPSATFTL